MASQTHKVPTGNVYRVAGKRRAVWYARYRLADGREVRKRIGPAWTERGGPAAGFHTKRTAEAWLADVLGQARRGTLPGLVRTGVTFGEACDEYLRYIAEDRARKATTVADYRSVIDFHLRPAFGTMRVEDITPLELEAWQAQLGHSAGRPLTNRSRNKILVVLHGIFKRACRAYGLPSNPAGELDKHPQPMSGDIEVFTPEEVHALIRAAANRQDGAIFAVAAFTGLRMGELRALHWQDIDYGRAVIRVRASYAQGELSTPKSGKVRSVPLVDAAAAPLARLMEREYFTAGSDLVFCEVEGRYLNDDSLRNRYHAALKRAGLRRLRFHDLRHTFGTLAITRADILEVQSWMGHADVKTTMRYLHYRDRSDAARRLAGAFEATVPVAAIEELPSPRAPT